MKRAINPLWLRASLLGSVWGSVEIIVGSFLHNVRFPFAGTLLAAIGVSLLVAGQSIWKERGIIWRAGLICALMKSISPSALIIGPMIGIASEAFCLEVFVRVFRGTRAGYFAGGAVAACLPFIQLVVGLIITYGFNIAELYVEVYRVVVANLGFLPVGAYDLIVLFLLVNVVLGLAAAALGIAVGRISLAGTLMAPPPHSAGPVGSWKDVNGIVRYSSGMLILSVCVIPLVLVAIAELALPWSSLIVGSYIILMLKRYPGVWRKFGKPRLWIEFVVITLLAGLLLGSLSSGGRGWTWDGLGVGVQMVLRALFMITAFTVASVELRNPMIIGWFLQRGMGQLPEAMEIAFDALPTMAARLADQRKLLRHPVETLSELLLAAKRRLMELEGNGAGERRTVFILTGERGSGKTTVLEGLIARLRSENFRVGGILSQVIMEGSERLGYDVFDLRSGERMPLARAGSPGGGVQAGAFRFSDEAVVFGRRALDPSILRACQLVIIDEIGPLEIGGGVWAPSLELLLESAPIPLLLVVRPSLVEEVSRRWSFKPEFIWSAGKASREALPGEMAARLRMFISQRERESAP